MKIKKFVLITAIAALVLATGGGRTIAQEKAPTQLAVVDIIQVFERLEEKKASDLEIRNLDNDLKEQRRKREESLQRQSDALRPNNSAALFKPGTPEYKQAQDQLLQDTMNYKAFVAVGDARLAMLKRLKTVEIYRKINAAIEKYARAKGIAIVFCIDELDLDGAQDLNAITGAITMQRKIMYAHPNFNITQDLITAMNSEYKHGAP
ncbi:MAG: OmpH family outer membrane protein [Phycisphaerales bacterium]|nr:OmpH family outer membrane protein [Phycisphaerales bacterium]